MKDLGLLLEGEGNLETKVSRSTSSDKFILAVAAWNRNSGKSVPFYIYNAKALYKGYF